MADKQPTTLFDIVRPLDTSDPAKVAPFVEFQTAFTGILQAAGVQFRPASLGSSCVNILPRKIWEKAQEKDGRLSSLSMDQAVRLWETFLPESPATLELVAGHVRAEKTQNDRLSFVLRGHKEGDKEQLNTEVDTCYARIEAICQPLRFHRNLSGALYFGSADSGNWKLSLATDTQTLLPIAVPLGPLTLRHHIGSQIVETHILHVTA